MKTLADHLLETRTPAELARDLAQHAKDKAALLDQVDALEHRLFWMTVRESDDVRALRLENQKLRDEIAALDVHVDFILSDHLLHGN